MPVCLRPDKTFKFALPKDQTIPAKDRPYFIGKFLTAGQRIEVLETIESIEKDDDLSFVQRTKAMDAAYNEQINRLVVGVVNVGDMTLEKLIPELTDAEKASLVYGIINGNEMSEDDVKN